MIDSVVDASLLGLANGNLDGRRPGNALDKRLRVIQQVNSGARRLRYNSRLLLEYRNIVKAMRNDLIEAFFLVLDQKGVLVATNRLSRQNFEKATACRWPSHDQHLLAAAIGGTRPDLLVTEELLASRKSCIRQSLRVTVHQVS